MYLSLATMPFLLECHTFWCPEGKAQHKTKRDTLKSSTKMLSALVDGGDEAVLRAALLFFQALFKAPMFFPLPSLIKNSYVCFFLSSIVIVLFILKDVCFRGIRSWVGEVTEDVSSKWYIGAFLISLYSCNWYIKNNDTVKNAFMKKYKNEPCLQFSFFLLNSTYPGPESSQPALPGLKPIALLFPPFPIHSGVQSSFCTGMAYFSAPIWRGRSIEQVPQSDLQKVYSRLEVITIAQDYKSCPSWIEKSLPILAENILSSFYVPMLPGSMTAWTVVDLYVCVYEVIQRFQSQRRSSHIVEKYCLHLFSDPFCRSVCSNRSSALHSGETS